MEPSSDGLLWVEELRYTSICVLHTQKPRGDLLDLSFMLSRESPGPWLKLGANRQSRFSRRFDSRRPQLSEH